ncbi:hypothetical protein [Thalassoglobus neptunius]|uniref:hypothetical protein n=1 Tax=Thalassoglobus neptunius TaxID=1938619 RepID=UPI0011B72039|nr:hypothetical protein [Thalassoglobus neptunius]
MADDRRSAVKEILLSEGLQGVIELAGQCALPFFVGVAISEVSGEQYTSSLISERLVDENFLQNLVYGFVTDRMQTASADWLAKTLAKHDNTAIKSLILAMLPFDASAWDVVDQEADTVKHNYWLIVKHWGCSTDVDSVARCSRELIAVGRSADAMDVICNAIHREVNLPVEVLFGPLESADMNSAFGQPSFGRHQITDYEIGMMLSALQDKDDVDEERLVALEWKYFRSFKYGYHGAPRTLFKRLSSDPKYYATLVSRTAKASREQLLSSCGHDENELALLENEVRRIASLLRMWTEIPGKTEGDSINYEELQSWVSQVRQTATELRCLDECDSRLGELFVNSPPDPDGKWPCQPVRTIMNQIATPHLSDGMVWGVRYSRGMVQRRNGGAQEHSLGDKYEMLAESIRIESVYISSILVRIAEEYRSEARLWDAREDWEY